MRIIGIDIGGTFTDVVVYDEATRRITAAKALTRRGDEAASVLECLEEAASGADGGLERVVHGTTIGTNAILERRGARTAVLATRGFRDLLEIGRTRRMAPNTLFDLSFRKPAPLVPRPLRFDVEERVDSAGAVIEPLAEPALRAIAASALAREEVGAVAVCYLHSYANPAHEEATRAILEDALPGVFVSPSHEVVPEYREFERLTTTVLNAFIGPLLDRYLEVLEGCPPARERRGAALHHGVERRGHAARPRAPDPGPDRALGARGRGDGGGRGSEGGGLRRGHHLRHGGDEHRCVPRPRRRAPGHRRQPHREHAPQGPAGGHEHGRGGRRERRVGLARRADPRRGRGARARTPGPSATASAGAR